MLTPTTFIRCWFVLIVLVGCGARGLDVSQDGSADRGPEDGRVRDDVATTPDRPPASDDADAGGGPTDTGSAPPSDGGQIPRDQIANQLHTVECQRQVKCGLQPTFADCVASTMPPISARIQADMMSGKIIYDPIEGKALVNWMSTLPCSLSVVNNPTTPAALKSHCGAAFHGTLPLGEGCVADDECATGLVCSSVHNGLPNQPPRCAAGNPYPKIGAFCNTGCDPSSSYCDTVKNPDNPLCEPLPTMVGQACEGLCGNDLVCTASGTCGTLAAPGDPCDSRMNFYPAVCDEPTQYCAPGSNTCQPLLGRGAPCQRGFDACAPTLYCDWATMTCAPRLPQGADCSGIEGGGPLCLGDMACDSTMKCALEPALVGESLLGCP